MLGLGQAKKLRAEKKQMICMEIDSRVTGQSTLASIAKGSAQ